MTPTTRTRRLVLIATTGVAAISTAGAYMAMTAFGVDALGMTPITAYATAGVLEMSLVTVALLAREAARDARPTGVLLTLTWGLSGLSGLFAAWHELHLGHPVAAAVFRFVVPLLAALMWHLALIGDRHLATGRTWTQAVITRRMHRLLMTAEAAHLAAQTDTGTLSARRRVARANAAARRARSVVLRTVDPAHMAPVMTAWVDAAHAVTDSLTHLTAHTRPAPSPTPQQFVPVREHITLAPIAQARALRAAGTRVADIATRLGRSERTVYRWLDEAA